MVVVVVVVSLFPHFPLLLSLVRLHRRRAVQDAINTTDTHVVVVVVAFVVVVPLLRPVPFPDKLHEFISLTL